MLTVERVERAEMQISKANAALDRIPGQVVDAVAAKLRALTLNLQHHIVADKLKAQVLVHRSGALGCSITHKAQRDAVSMRTLLGEAAALRKHAGWWKVAPAVRRHIDETERDARRHLALVVVKQKVRSDAADTAAKHQQAMPARGVAFNRMMQH